MFRLAEGKKADDVKAMCQQRIQDLKDSFDGYLPEVPGGAEMDAVLGAGAVREAAVSVLEGLRHIQVGRGEPGQPLYKGCHHPGGRQQGAHPGGQQELSAGGGSSGALPSLPREEAPEAARGEEVSGSRGGWYSTGSSSCQTPAPSRAMERCKAPSTTC